MQIMRTNANTANKIIYPALSYKIVGIGYRVQNSLGRFCREFQYARAFEEELKNEGLTYQREKYLPLQKDDKTIGKNWVDFVIEDKIAVDLKAKTFVDRNDYYQMQRYLKLCNLKLGLIINLQNKYLKPKRVLNSRYSQDS